MSRRSFGLICSVKFFLQPLNLSSNFVLRGLARRCLILYKHIPSSEREAALKTRFEGEIDEAWYTEWKNYLEGLSEKKFEWTFNKKSLHLFEVYTKYLGKIANKRGEKCAAYYNISMFSLQNTLIAMSSIQAALRDNNEVLPEDVKKAFIDLKSFWDLELDYVTQKLNGNIDYTNLGKNEYNFRPCIDYLKDKGCISKEMSNISKQDFISWIADTIGCSKEIAESTYYKPMRNAGLIDSKQFGQHGSKVWLKNVN